MAMPITPGIIQTVLGNGEEGFGGDGGPALHAACETPYMCAFDTQGHMFVCMGQHHRIRRMDANTGIITLVAGTGDSGYSGDGGAALRATFNMPYGLTVDANGDIYVAERGNPIVRKIDGTTGLITTLAGTGEKGYSGDGGPANKAMLREPNDVFLDGKGGLLIADVQDQRIRRVDLRTGLISTFAGTGEKSRAGDGKRAIDASLMGPRAVCMDTLGNTYICEREGNGVRKVNAQGILTTIAGAEAVRGYTGDGGPALAATWGAPKAMRCDLQNNIIVVDSENNAVRRIDARTGIVTTIAGGHAGDDGDGGPATAAGLARPHGCGLDAAGNLYIADTHNHRVRVVGL
jgi:DNA-binding beta-propeller fold protein YncE